VVANVVQVAVSAADGDVEGRARSETKDGREIESSEPAWCVERAGEDEAMPTIKETARAFGAKIAGRERVRCVDDAVVNQTRERVSSAERIAETTFAAMKTVAQLNRQSMIETVADGSELLNVRLRRVGAKHVQGIERDVERGRRTDAVEIE